MSKPISYNPTYDIVQLLINCHLNKHTIQLSSGILKRKTMQTNHLEYDVIKRENYWILDNALANPTGLLSK